MSVVIHAHYDGELRCSLVHGPSSTALQTDAPKDNAGRGELFSPTDLVATALVSCALTTVAIKGAKEGIDITGAAGSVTKHMSQEGPRRIVALDVAFEVPASVTAALRPRLEEIARTCPVALSLGPEVRVEMTFSYG